jgi:hypothetical protein
MPPLRVGGQDGDLEGICVQTIAWFSCGVASAVAAKLALQSNEHTRVVYCDTMVTEHSDNQRFFNAVEKWLGVPITVISSSKFRDVDEVFEKVRYMSGPKGARCTVEMKKVPRFEYQRHDDVHVFGYTVEEKKRIKRFKDANPELLTWWPLMDRGLTKDDCKNIIEIGAGIKLPAMYALGFKNNNCLGCVKASSPKYWNMVRTHFPEVFERRAKQSRELGCRLTRQDGVRIFLDELRTENMMEVKEDLSCGPECKA